MAELNYEQVLTDSIAIAKGELGKYWEKVSSLSEHYIKQYAEDLYILHRERALGKITEEEFQYYSKLHQDSLRNIFLAIKGVGLNTAQRIVNSIIGIVETAVLAVVGL